MAENRFPLLFVAFIIVLGGYVRLVDLSEANFNGDELNFYYAALSLEETGRPLLPSGTEYDRGIDITRLTGLALEVVEPPELAARLPSALFGLLNLILIAFVAWKIAGPWSAVWATLLLAIYPEAIVQSRMTRFYTLQLNYGILALATGWYALKTSGFRSSSDSKQLMRSWAWALATALLFAMALRIQLTTLSVIAGWLACVVAAAVFDLLSRGRRGWRYSFPIQATAMALVITIVAFVAATPTILTVLRRSQFVANWSGRGHVLSYYYMLSDVLPLVVSLLPAIFLIALFKKPRLAVYLGIWFSVPVLLHSVAFPWKGERYIFLAMPALFIATGIAAAAASGALFRAVYARRAELAPGNTLNRGLAGLVTAIVLLFAIVTTSAFNQARRIPPHPKAIDWEAAAAIIDSIPDSRLIPAGSAAPLAALYYWGRLDFVVGTDFLERTTDDQGNAATQAEGGPDYYAGAPTIVSPTGIRTTYAAERAVLIGIDWDRWRYNNIDPDLRRTLQRNAVELCKSRCGDLYLFLWEFGDTSVDSDPAAGL